MPKPATRLPQAAPPAPEPAPMLTPAPDNGRPFAEQPGQQPATGQAPTRIPRRGKQLGARIPTDLYERLVACAQATRIPQGRLIERALDAELKSHGF
ncbi:MULTISPECIES: ribbon-helix-helix domain-containing protein [Kineococcus]|uniref:ribbon-helix-helix domain-containing protein n=1 Tax=unclassified Kineococcus TaxID=2621656 RepID=UPI003D7DA609